jgi:hypothetical protein
MTLATLTALYAAKADTAAALAATAPRTDARWDAIQADNDADDALTAGKQAARKALGHKAARQLISDAKAAA